MLVTIFEVFWCFDWMVGFLCFDEVTSEGFF